MWLLFPSEEHLLGHLCTLRINRCSRASFHTFPYPLAYVFLLVVARSLSASQQIGMDDSKHGGQTYPEMVKGATSA